MTDADIIGKIKSHGIDAARLKGALDARDNWGDMIHSFEFLTVLGVVCDAMVKEDKQ
jgi:hypothetical protein